METLLPQIALDLAIPAPDDPASLFGAGVGEVHMEIGFGGGEHLIAQASRRPDVGFIGCEPFVNGMAKALAAIEAQALSNIRPYLGDALSVAQWLRPGSIAGIDVLYPDPWPKRRHWKRRLIQSETVAAMARVLRVGAPVRLATDSADYADWILLRFLATPDFAWTAERAEDWRDPWPDFPGTRYEIKAKREGRLPCYLVFRRV